MSIFCTFAQWKIIRGGDMGGMFETGIYYYASPV